MQNAIVFFSLFAMVGYAQGWPSLPSILGNKSLPSNSILKKVNLEEINLLSEKTPCTCGIFLNGQFQKGASTIEDENAALLLETGTTMYPCGPQGDKQCLNKCVEMMVSHLANAGPMICASIDRDCFKERAYLFTQNCEDTWRNTHFSAGKEFCCEGGVPFKCPRGKGALPASKNL